MSNNNHDIGKVIYTKNYVNKCKCGETVTQQLFIEVPEGLTELELMQKAVITNGKIYLGICKCGNIFKTTYIKS